MEKGLLQLALRCITFVLFINVLSQAQNIGPIGQSILQAQRENLYFKNVDLFSEITFYPEYGLQSGAKVPNLVKAELNTNSIHEILRNKSSNLSLRIPLPNQKIVNLLLEEQFLWDNEGRITTSDDPNGRLLQGGRYYRGIIDGDLKSIAAISVFEDEVIGIIANEELGNIVIGKEIAQLNNKEQNLQHVIYCEKDLPQKNPFYCAIDELSHTIAQQHEEDNAEASTFPNRCKAVKVYLECSNRLFTDKGSSVAAVETYMTGLFNVVKALYANEKVVVEISEIKVWNTPDPYLKTTLAEILFDYANRRKNNFNGTIAQLVTTFPVQQQGGIAFLDGMCRTWDPQTGGPLSFAYIYNTYSSLPVYSWSVEVMTHEMGHNLGSFHTHSCVWGPNRNQQIDNCQPADIGGCNNGTTPSGGGTIMSYCHLTGVGINFSKGFGQEPGDTIRYSFRVKSCIPSTITPIASHSVGGPYFEGDSFKLVAKPYNKNYMYDWFHYDYRTNKTNDTSLTAKSSGIYTLAISSTANTCTEYSKPDTILFNDFLVNLGCPKINGRRDSFFREVMIQVDNPTYTTDSIEFPDSLYSMIPKNALDPLVEIQMTITPRGASFTRSVVSQYESPSNIGISNKLWTPNDLAPFNVKTATTYSRILGDFNPGGVWKFSGIDTRIDAGIDAFVTYKIVLSWRMRDSVEECDVILCDNKAKLLDAGITNAQYKWSTGQLTRSITTQQEGRIGVTVTKGSRIASHQINLIRTNTQFRQEVEICTGDTLFIGKHKYSLAGSYVDTLTAITGCDSILTTLLNLKPILRTYDTLSKCYGERYNNLILRNDTSIQIHRTGVNQCDSIHSIFFKVNPELKSSFQYDKKCDDQGTELLTEINGGTQPYNTIWNTGDTTTSLNNVKSGTYSLDIIDAQNCKITKSIQVENYDSVSIQESIQNVKCFGESNGSIILKTLSGTAPFNFNWNTGRQTDTLNQLSQGKYTVIIFDANGCRFEKTYEVMAPDLIFVDANVQASFGNNGSIELLVLGGTKPYKYLWSTGDTTQMISELIPGTYTVTISDANGCMNVQRYDVQNKVSVIDVKENSSIQVLPNPFEEILKVFSSVVNIESVELHSLEGQKIFEFKGLHSNWINLNVQSIPAGYYLLKIKDSHGQSYNRSVVKR